MEVGFRRLLKKASLRGGFFDAREPELAHDKTSKQTQLNVNECCLLDKKNLPEGRFHATFLRSNLSRFVA